MPSDLISLAAASQLLDVSSERVRQLVVAGDLPGVRFGNAWAVSRDAVSARRQASNRRGRPLGPKRAWLSIIDGRVDLLNASRFRNRGGVHKCSMSASDADHLLDQGAAVQSGVSAAIHFGEPLAAKPDRLDMYVSSAVFESLDSMVVAVPDALGSVVMRIVPDEVWSIVLDASEQSNESRLVAPRAAAALDLTASGDPRHWIAAENLVAVGE